MMKNSSIDSNIKFIEEIIQTLEPVLPGQAPIHDFVHHNTLHGFQHLNFQQAIEQYQQETGYDGYLKSETFRLFYQQGRIDDEDLTAVLKRFFSDSLSDILLESSSFSMTREYLYRSVLMQTIEALPQGSLEWELTCLQTKDPDAYQLLRTLCHKFQLDPQNIELVGSMDSLHDAELEQLMQTTRDDIRAEFGRLGSTITLRELILRLTGLDILDEIRSYLIRIAGSGLDEGMAPWHLSDVAMRENWYVFWLRSLRFDPEFLFHGHKDWLSVISHLPSDPVKAIAQQFEMLGIDQERWLPYLRRLALEIPGWFGLVNWHAHSGENTAMKQNLAGLLAIRMVYERLYAFKICRQFKFHSPVVNKLERFFLKHPEIWLVRKAYFSGQLSESATMALSDLIDSNASSDMRSIIAILGPQSFIPEVTLHNQVWKLFQLLRHCSLNGLWLERLRPDCLLDLLMVAEQFQVSHCQWVWLNAYEQHYQRVLLEAIHANHGRGRWLTRSECRPKAQVVLCMDDREEGFRRHLEEIDSKIETLGAAGFFGMAINYRGMNDQEAVDLCPIVVTPLHIIEELPVEGQENRVTQQQLGQTKIRGFLKFVFHTISRETLGAYFWILVLWPAFLLQLLIKVFCPEKQRCFWHWIQRRVSPDILTRLKAQTENVVPVLHSKNRQLGFTPQEMADRVKAFLVNMGLTDGFAQIVVVMGHGSSSQNNPHMAAYDCGACSGRHGGPNARIFAEAANHSEVRRLLQLGDIQIPDDCWFIGAEHNTGNEQITYFDLDLVPAHLSGVFQELQQSLSNAQERSSHERCRRLVSAPKNPSLKQALRHFRNRTADFSQARPELGHATNAAAFIGRRAHTQGAFFDRRLFLISYDPSQDLDGALLEGILLAVGPVGAGINLEYYFSTVNNEFLGCGSKVPHNVTGYFGVMEGAFSDLRTGLPRQMIEIHEAMRLQLVVEAKTEILEALYHRQPMLKELIGGGWIHLTAKNPETGVLSVFSPTSGFETWSSFRSVEMRNTSFDCYQGKQEAINPILIKQPQKDWSSHA